MDFKKIIKDIDFVRFGITALGIGTAILGNVQAKKDKEDMHKMISEEVEKATNK